VQGAGLDLLCKMGDTVTKGQAVYRVYAAYPADLEFARQACARNSAFHIGRADESPSLYVEF
jgi:thymidine phosphorylase